MKTLHEAIDAIVARVATQARVTPHDVRTIVTEEMTHVAPGRIPLSADLPQSVDPIALELRHLAIVRAKASEARGLLSDLEVGLRTELESVQIAISHASQFARTRMDRLCGVAAMDCDGAADKERNAWGRRHPGTMVVKEPTTGEASAAEECKAAPAEEREALPGETPPDGEVPW